MPVNGVDYILFSATITKASSALLIKALDAEQSKGAREIDIDLNSPGGDVDAADLVVADMDRLHAEDGVIFKVWNVKLVASAATLIFLDAQQRYTAPNAAFVFHAPYLDAKGSFSAEALRRDADHIDQIKRVMRDTLLARTKLTRDQADLYTNRTVILSADDARTDGVVDDIRLPTAPKEAHVWVIRQKPRGAAAAKPPAAPG